MRVQSVNISEVQSARYLGQAVQTGIYKTPRGGSHRVERLNIVGDEQADLNNHGGEHKAVYAFGAQHFSHWRQVLRKDDFQPGLLGENLTIDVLDESQIKIGDQFEIGTTLLEVTQPRVPCFKLAMKTEQKRFPRMFVQFGHTGLYLRVLLTGELKAGDTVFHRKLGESRHSVAALFEAVHDPAAADRRIKLQDALDNPALSSEWRHLIEQRLQRIAC